MGHITLNMTNKYTSLTISHLKKSHEKHSPFRVGTSGSTEVFGDGYRDVRSWKCTGSSRTLPTYSFTNVYDNSTSQIGAWLLSAFDVVDLLVCGFQRVAFLFPLRHVS